MSHYQEQREEWYKKARDDAKKRAEEKASVF